MVTRTPGSPTPPLISFASPPVDSFMIGPKSTTVRQVYTPSGVVTATTEEGEDLDTLDTVVVAAAEASEGELIEALPGTGASSSTCE